MISAIKRVIKENHRVGQRFCDCGQNLREQYIIAAVTDDPVAMSERLPAIVAASMRDQAQGGFCLLDHAAGVYLRAIEDAMIERDDEIIAELKAKASPAVKKASGF